jgi:hypothetical protein
MKKTSKSLRACDDCSVRDYGTDTYPLWQETTNGVDREDPMRFAGHERDFFTSSPPSIPYLDYMHARYYDPNITDSEAKPDNSDNS